MGLFDSYFDPEQFGEGGGLLGRLIALHQQQDMYQPNTASNQAPAVSQTLSPTLPSLGSPNYDQSLSALRPAVQDSPVQYAVGAPEPTSNSNQNDIQKVGITSDQSVYCKTMKNLCHNECVGLAFGRDAFGPYRACVRTCMHNAGCFDF
jgi:hypothetical protein